MSRLPGLVGASVALLLALPSTAVAQVSERSVVFTSDPSRALVIERDAGDTRSAVRLVMAQPAISSQLIDNLNASHHFRALLTDLFLFDEVLKSSAREGV